MFELILNGVFGWIIIICFFVLVARVGKIKEYTRKLYQYEKIRMVEDGLISPETKRFTKWSFDENDHLVPATTQSSPTA